MEAQVERLMAEKAEAEEFARRAVSQVQAEQSLRLDAQSQASAMPEQLIAERADRQRGESMAQTTVNLAQASLQQLAQHTEAEAAIKLGCYNEAMNAADMAIRIDDQDHKANPNTGPLS